MMGKRIMKNFFLPITVPIDIPKQWEYINGLMQERRDSSALAMELLQPYTIPRYSLNWTHEL